MQNFAVVAAATATTISAKLAVAETRSTLIFARTKTFNYARTSFVSLTAAFTLSMYSRYPI